ncbi:MAG: hypothetical protein MUC29_05375 [Pyrinomonadaceae bacterium]|nr:hypothetical protein [Pyrinomonadaceae bacterium]
MDEDPRKAISDFQKKNVSSIHFDLNRSDLRPETTRVYEQRLHHDLNLRNLATKGDLKECQERLQIRLIQEYNYKKIEAAIKHVDGDNPEEALVLIADCPPCILHMEMRTTLKFLQVILDDGLKQLKARKASDKEIEEYLQSVNLIFNEQIFGNPDRPYTFSLRYDSQKKLIEDVTLDGERCRTLSTNFAPLLNLIYNNVEKQNKWRKIINNYIMAFKILRSKEDLSFEEIQKFQYYVDVFFQEYMLLVGKRGITNYFHMLGSGHVAEYLKECGNLYIHSQQGWEAFNSFVKVYYFRRTTRGGGRSSDSNRIRPLAKWLARRLIWNAGYTFEQIKEEVEKLGSGTINSIPELEQQKTIHEDEKEDDDDSLCSGELYGVDEYSKIKADTATSEILVKDNHDSTTLPPFCVPINETQSFAPKSENDITTLEEKHDYTL